MQGAATTLLFRERAKNFHIARPGVGVEGEKGGCIRDVGWLRWWWLMGAKARAGRMRPEGDSRRRGLSDGQNQQPTALQLPQGSATEDDGDLPCRKNASDL